MWRIFFRASKEIELLRKSWMAAMNGNSKIAAECVTYQKMIDESLSWVNILFSVTIVNA